MSLGASNTGAVVLVGVAVLRYGVVVELRELVWVPLLVGVVGVGVTAVE